jgi:hypothetical protein
MAAANQQGVTDKLPVKFGGLFGAIAFVAGYVLIYALLTVDDLTPRENAIESVGQFFYNAQFVNLVNGDLAFNPLFQSDFGSALTLPAVGYTILVSLVLIGAGYLLVNRMSVQPATPDEGARAGATLVVGYLPLAILGIFLFEFDNTAPDIFTGVVLAGILFPVVLGAIGGYLSARGNG